MDTFRLKNKIAKITSIKTVLFRMKWKAIEPQQGDFITENADNMIAWADSNNITVRGVSES